MTIAKRKLLAVSVLLLLLITVFVGIFGVWGSVSAQESGAPCYDSTAILDDLATLDLNAYPIDHAGTVQLILLAEYAYTYRIDGRGNYGIYLYVYNPAQIVFDLKSIKNGVQIAVGYNEAGAPISYEKYQLKYCDQSEDLRFIKFKIVDRKSEYDGQKIVDRVRRDRRQYDVSGIELLTKGAANADDYPVGGSYVYTGFGKGCGEDLAAESTLNYAAGELETVQLDIKNNHTAYRDLSDPTVSVHSQINSVWFSIPKTITRRFDSMKRIKAEWYEYGTFPMIFTSSNAVYSGLQPFLGIDKGVNINAAIPFQLGTDYARTYDALGVRFVYVFDWAYNHYIEGISTVKPSSLDRNTVRAGYTSGNGAQYRSLNWLFLIDDPTDFNVSMTDMRQYVQSFDNDRKIDGRYSSKLFLDGYVGYRPTGHIVADFYDTDGIPFYELNPSASYYRNLQDVFYLRNEAGQDQLLRSPIELVETTEGSIETKYLINKNDAERFQSFYTERSDTDDVFVLHYAVSDYTAQAVYVTKTGDPLEDYDNASTFLVKQRAFMDFDVIEFEFERDGLSYVLPAVSSPIDVIGNVDTKPPVPQSFWDKVLALLDRFKTVAIVIGALLGTLIVIAICKPIFTLIAEIIALPAEAAGTLDKKRRKKK